VASSDTAFVPGQARGRSLARVSGAQGESSGGNVEEVFVRHALGVPLLCQKRKLLLARVLLRSRYSA
jgi:hypothetical protein